MQKHLDEVFLEKQKEFELLEYLKQKKEYDKKLYQYINEGSARIGENDVKFHYETFFNSIKLAIPEELKLTDIDSYNKILSSKSKDLNMILTCVPGMPRELTLKSYKEQLSQKMKSHAGIPLKWIEEGIKMKDEYKITYVSFINPVDDIKSYNFIFYLLIGSNTVIVNFNCMGERINDWDAVGKGIMECLEIVNNKGEE